MALSDKKTHFANTSRMSLKTTKMAQRSTSRSCAAGESWSPRRGGACSQRAPSWWLRGLWSSEFALRLKVPDARPGDKAARERHFSGRKGGWGARRFAFNPISVCDYLLHCEQLSVLICNCLPSSCLEKISYQVKCLRWEQNP